MSSRHHTPGISQSPRDIGNRGLRGILGHHQQRTADIREALYIKPLGRQQHLVRNLGDNKQAYRVGSNLPGLTFKPGEVVQLSSNTGHPGENIISIAPPGKKGSMPGFQGSGGVTFTEPTLEAPATPISSDFDYVAITVESTAPDNLITMSHYIDETWQSDYIFRDSVLADASFSMFQISSSYDSGRIVWLAQSGSSGNNDKIGSHSVAGDSDRLDIGGPPWTIGMPWIYNSEVYWVEGISTDPTFTLKKAALDLTGSTTVDTVTASANPSTTYSETATWVVGSKAFTGVSSTTPKVLIEWDLAAGSGTELSEPTSLFTNWDITGINYEVVGGRDMLGIGASDPDNTSVLFQLPTDGDTDPTALWPTRSEWSLATGTEFFARVVPGDSTQVILERAGLTLNDIIYTNTGQTFASPIYVDHKESAGEAEAKHSFSPDSHPTNSRTPIIMFPVETAP